ncbi:MULTISPECIES: hypothetical protein [Brevundimonas]|uniref:hypothetical protein n=1 Tax=Brevundimonas TaxID=41275 RepID=UPI00320B218F
MSRSSSEHWSLSRSLAFLAAVFAITFGTFLPTAVAASSALGEPVMLCSGDMAMVVYDAEGHPKPVKGTDLGSLSCAAALLSNLAAIDSPPPSVPIRMRVARSKPALSPFAAVSAEGREALRPPSTAPPHA